MSARILFMTSEKIFLNDTNKYIQLLQENGYKLEDLEKEAGRIRDQISKMINVPKKKIDNRLMYLKRKHFYKN